MERLRGLIREVHRRSLWQVLGIYAVASWGVLSVVDTAGGAIGLPDWFSPVAFALLVVGLPIVLATAFVQEGGPGREATDVEATGALTSASVPGPAAGLFTWRNAILGGVGAFALLGFVGTGWILFGDGLRPSSVEQSVAVLPFEDLSPQGDQQYFVEGLSGEIISALSRIGGLKVSNQTSTFLLAERGADIATIANTLGVANVLEGSLRKEGDQIRVIATLVEAETGFQIWSDTYNRELNDIIELQNELARSVAEELRAELTGVEILGLAGPATANREAYDHYLRGQQLVRQRSGETILAAIDAFESAVQADPSYAPAHAGLASAYTLAGIFISLPPDSSYIWAGRSIAYADRAIELDSMNAEAHAARAWAATPLTEHLRGAGIDLELIDRHYRRALSLQPSSADVLGWYGQFLSMQGRHEEALELQERSIDLDPLAPGRWVGYEGSARMARAWELALQHNRRARQLQPGIGGPSALGEVGLLLLLGRAHECLELELSLTVFEAMCLHEVGRAEDAEALIVPVVASAGSSGDLVEALVAYYAWTGQVDETLRWLERALDLRPNSTVLAWLSAGIWDPVLARDEERVRSEVARLQGEAYERVLRESRRIQLP